MKKPYGKGPATHPGPESCAGHGNMTGEALTRVHAGQLLSSEITYSAFGQPAPNAIPALAHLVVGTRRAPCWTAHSEAVKESAGRPERP